MIKNNNKTAFSLIELSIVLTIIAVIISGSITISETAIKKARKENTIDKLKQIKEAINIYVYINKKLPCPASMHNITTDSQYASMAGSDGDCTAAGVINSSDTSADTLIYGALPAKTLSLSSDLAQDDFDNKFSYIVVQDLTSQYLDSNNLGFEGTDDADMDLIIIKEGVSGSNITEKAAYIVISHGPNGLGAYNINSGSTQNAITAITSDEEDNIYKSNFDNIFITNSSNGDFDDIFIYNIRETIMHQSTGFETTICREENSSYTPSCSSSAITFPAAQYNELSTSSCGCGTMVTLAQRRCGLNGKWQDPPETICY